MPRYFFAVIGVLVAGVLWLLLRSARPEAVTRGDLRVLEYGAAWRWLVRVFWLGPVVIAIAGIAAPPSAEEWWIPFALVGGFTALCAPLHLEVVKRRVEVTPEALTARSAWRAPVRIAWQEITMVLWQAGANELEIHAVAGRRVRVSPWLSGKATLADELARRAAHVPRLGEALAPFCGFGGGKR